VRIDIDIDGKRFIGTYGGCFHDESGPFDDYGFQFGDLSISGIKEKDAVSLAVELMNHLNVNGVEFEFYFDKLSGHKFIREAD